MPMRYADYSRLRRRVKMEAGLFQDQAMMLRKLVAVHRADTRQNFQISGIRMPRGYKQRQHVT